MLSEKVTVQNRSERHRVDRENMIQECGNPIVEDDFHGFSHRNCEGTEQLRTGNCETIYVTLFGHVSTCMAGTLPSALPDT